MTNFNNGNKNVGHAGLKKISELSEQCLSPSHNPPMYVSLTNGVYEYTCPTCGVVTIFTVSNPTY